MPNHNTQEVLKQLKVSVIVPGRLHGFDMAIYFQKLGVLNQLVTGYPSRYVLPFGIRKPYIKSLYINEVINRTTNFLGIGYPFDFLACEAFDFLASKVIKYNSDVYFIWSGYALKTIKILRKKNPNAKIILVRGSAHIEEQERLLKKVSSGKKQQINRRIIEKELKEYHETDYITIPSSYAFNTFIEKGFDKEKLFTNFLGVDLFDFSYVEKKTKNGHLNVGYIGTIGKQKNVGALIEVIKELNNTGKSIFLYLTGEIEKSFDKDLIYKNPFVYYSPKLPQKLLVHAYHKLNIFVLNSVQDGFGMVLLQAMSSGCPVIATENSGGPDVISAYKNGILIPAFDNFALKQAIMWFYKHQSEISTMGEASRKISENGFTWDDFGKRNIDFINKIIKD